MITKPPLSCSAIKNSTKKTIATRSTKKREDKIETILKWKNLGRVGVCSICKQTRMKRRESARETFVSLTLCLERDGRDKRERKGGQGTHQLNSIPTKPMKDLNEMQSSE